METGKLKIKYITLDAIAAGIGIAQIDLARFVCGSIREVMTARKVGRYTGLPWQRLRDMMPVDLEAVLLQAYLENHYPWLQHIRSNARDYENNSRVSA